MAAVVPQAGSSHGPQSVPSSMNTTTTTTATGVVTFADSTFLSGPNSSSNIVPNSRAIAHLTRDFLTSVLVQPTPSSSSTSTPEPVANLKRKQPSGEGSTSLNTRFGSFPHTSLLVPAGSQVRSASGAGFIHILRPTPELWTLSLPHRTQVVYTPDSSYILHRLRVRPGSRIIEAGAGSGSFTHASARAVYNGIHEKKSTIQTDGTTTKEGEEATTTDNSGSGSGGITGLTDSQGRVLSFEFHTDRASILRLELRQHGLHQIVTVTHRDVCASGFSLPDPELDIGGNTYATAVFLDLPAPWLAIPHLTRENGSLSQTKAVRICCFSPCLEQALRTIAVLREQGWTEEDLVEVAHKRLEVRRMGPNGREIGAKARSQGDDEIKIASVEDSVSKLKKQLWHRKTKQARQRERLAKRRKLDEDGNEEVQDNDSDIDMDADDDDDEVEEATEAAEEDSGNGRLHLFKQGRVQVRTEPELKTHTSYLVFAVLPLPWTEEDEIAAKSKYTLPPRPAPQVNPKTGKDYTSGGKAPKPAADGKLSKTQEKKLRKAQEKAAKLASESNQTPKTDEADA
ncbi:tRNA (adenine-N(1)-)-methyltransferase catalytic subunit trm61 [Arthrobotrys musiformis]|uniref:tRNA (adenine(58)-N(1))-methyltransferase catalytic subunit TRM61 n=1 Tax=Arthrobotrys musiformis TaxID=47236 RepID=A0AAV9WKM7_9PEZI